MRRWLRAPPEQTEVLTRFGGRMDVILLPFTGPLTSNLPLASKAEDEVTEKNLAGEVV